MIRILTDSASDYPEQLLERQDVTMLRMEIQFGRESFRDGIELSKQAFYQRLRESEELPVTSQITPETFRQAFEPIIAAGDEIIGIFLSSKLSGTFQSAQIAAEMVGSERIHLVDSMNVSFGEGLLVAQAVRLREAGKTARGIAAELTALRERIVIYAAVETLKYLRKGGRLSAAAAMAGSMLGVTPVVTVEKGEVVPACKVRGRKAAMAYIRKQWEEQPMDRAYPLHFGHADGEEALETMRGLYPPMESVDFAIGSTVGTHVGPGTVGVAYIRK